MGFVNVCFTKRAVKLLFLFISCCAVFFLAACADKEADNVQLSGPTMGTSYNITLVAPDNFQIDKAKLQLLVDEELKQLNQTFSTYIDDSELSLLNKALVGTPYPVSQQLFDVLVLSLEVSWLSSGAFDTTVGPLVDLWGFGGGSKGGKDHVPSDAAIARQLDRVGFSNVELNLFSNEVTKNKPVSIDLSAVAKGFAVDRIAELLLASGCQDFMVEIGGELRLQGNSPRGTPWRIAIEQPENQVGAINRALNLSGVGLATSGDYRNYFEIDGQRYSHTINPTTGRPITHKLASVTVIADSTAYADAVATAINVMGPAKGLLMAEDADLAVYLLVKTDDGFEAQYSSAFTPYLN
jgi:thiamine biosynthesis lipoprotein